jgi:steroid delta-isomerase-like uncharacterized protein
MSGRGSLQENCPVQVGHAALDAATLARPTCSQHYDQQMAENESVVRRFYDRFNDGDVVAAAQQYAEQCEWDFPAFGTKCRTRQEVLDVCRGWRTAFPDGRVEVVNLLDCGETIVVEWNSFGTWTGPLAGEALEPNGREFRRRGCAVTEVRAGQIVRCRDYFDRANMYGPLGLVHLLTL